MSLTPTQAAQLEAAAARAPKVDALWLWTGGGQEHTEFRQIRDTLQKAREEIQATHALVEQLQRIVLELHGVTGTTTPEKV